MKVHVRFFGFSAEMAGCRECDVETSEATVAGVVEALRREFPILKRGLDASVRYAVGTEYAKESTMVREGEVVSVIPPVAGG